MRIFLVDDHVSFCEGLIAAVKAIQPNYKFDFVSDAEFVPTQLVGRSEYDLIITDLLMPGWGGIELIKYLNRNIEHPPLMVMSSVRDDRTIQDVLDLGVVGYVPKSYTTKQIVSAIETCRLGNIHVPSFFTPPDSDSAPIDAPSPRVKLTKRQAEILLLMDQGLTNQDIADKLCIGRSTVKTHIRQLFLSFEVNSRIACLRAARANGALS